MRAGKTITYNRRYMLQTAGFFCFINSGISCYYINQSQKYIKTSGTIAQLRGSHRIAYEYQVGPRDYTGRRITHGQ